MRYESTVIVADTTKARLATIATVNQTVVQITEMDLLPGKILLATCSVTNYYGQTVNSTILSYSVPEAGQYLVQQGFPPICSKCHNSCRSCVGATAANCTSCLGDNFVLNKGVCVCKPGLFMRPNTTGVCEGNISH